jgi:hypothetical protein
LARRFAETDMSEFETTDTLGTTDAQSATSKKQQAKQLAGQAGQALKSEAQTFAQTAQERARAEAQKRTEAATQTLHTFANAIRSAGDELGQADQSPAARLVRQAADGLEGLATNLAGKQPEDLLNDVRDFGRRSPIAFIGGAVLIGVALGRFVRASEAAAADQVYGGGATYAGATGVETFPLTETSAYPASAAATGDVSTGLTAEEDTFDGSSEYSGAQAGGVESSLGDDLGSATPSDAGSSTSVIDTEDGTAGTDAGGVTGPGGSSQRQGF